MRSRAALVALALAASAALALAAPAVVARDAAAPPRQVGDEDGGGEATGGAGGTGAPAGADDPGGGAGGELPAEVPDEVAEALAGAGSTWSRSSELSVVEEARRVLEEADERDDCVLARAGYLDLSGRAWGCVTQGSGWAEVCVVWESGDGSGSEVRAWRLAAGELAAWQEGG